MQILSTEHWSLLSARSLAYNEAFTRASMFLTFVSMTFVGLALLAQATGFNSDFLLVAGVALAFDLVIALVTFIRVAAANLEDTLAIQGMNRIRHAYVEIAPEAARYFTAGTTDDFAGVLKSYGTGSTPSALSNIGYGLSTSLGLVGLVTAMLAGLLGAVVAIGVGTSTVVAVFVAVATGLVVMGVLIAGAFTAVSRATSNLEVRFPTPEDEATR
jgi:hypothetical protein